MKNEKTKIACYQMKVLFIAYDIDEKKIGEGIVILPKRYCDVPQDYQRNIFEQLKEQFSNVIFFYYVGTVHNQYNNA